MGVMKWLSRDDKFQDDSMRKRFEYTSKQNIVELQSYNDTVYIFFLWRKIWLQQCSQNIERIGNNR